MLEQTSQVLSLVLFDQIFVFILKVIFVLFILVSASVSPSVYFRVTLIVLLLDPFSDDAGQTLKLVQTDYVCCATGQLLLIIVWCLCSCSSAGMGTQTLSPTHVFCLYLSILTFIEAFMSCFIFKKIYINLKMKKNTCKTDCFMQPSMYLEETSQRGTAA